jgi:hypothetical protein
MEGYPEHALPKRLNVWIGATIASKCSRLKGIAYLRDLRCHADCPVQYDFGRRKKFIVVAPKLAVSRDHPCNVRPATFPQWQKSSDRRFRETTKLGTIEMINNIGLRQVSRRHPTYFALDWLPDSMIYQRLYIIRAPSSTTKYG